MTPTRKRVARFAGIGALALAGGSTLVFGGIRWGATLAFAAVDVTYFHTADFKHYRDSVRYKALGDSIVAAEEKKWLADRLSRIEAREQRIESAVDEIRECQRRPERCK